MDQLLTYGLVLNKLSVMLPSLALVPKRGHERKERISIPSHTELFRELGWAGNWGLR